LRSKLSSLAFALLSIYLTLKNFRESSRNRNIIKTHYKTTCYKYIVLPKQYWLDYCFGNTRQRYMVFIFTESGAIMFNHKFSKKNRWGLTAMVAAGLFLVAGQASATAFDGGIPAGWTGAGNYGTLGANGVVAASAEGGKYGWVVSDNVTTGLGLPGIGGTTGSRLRSGVFGASAGDELQFYFNYVTSDGAGFADYAWARLLDSALNPVAVLFTARTTPAGNSVPGFNLPVIAATTTPANVTIHAGGPVWSPLGGDSGNCFDTGCGYTGWVESDYTIALAGNYILEFGVVNWSDNIWQSGLAFDGITVAGKPIDPQGVPEPASLALLGIGLVGLGAIRRRKAA
jgi:hypothetical protein